MGNILVPKTQKHLLGLISYQLIVSALHNLLLGGRLRENMGTRIFPRREHASNTSKPKADIRSCFFSDECVVYHYRQGLYIPRRTITKTGAASRVLRPIFAQRPMGAPDLEFYRGQLSISLFFPSQWAAPKFRIGCPSQQAILPRLQCPLPYGYSFSEP